MPGYNVRANPRGGEPRITPVELPLSALVERARANAIPGQRHILGITGAPGAGKSTIAAQLVAALGSELAVLVPMDGFHLANVVLESLGRRSRKGALDTFDAAGYANLLQRLHHSSMSSEEPGDTVYAPEFRRDIEEPIASAIPVHPGIPLVITEGNYLLVGSGAWARARSYVDDVWYIEPDDAVRQQRLVARHVAYGKSPDEARAWALGSDQTNADLIASTMTGADLIVRVR